MTGKFGGLAIEVDRPGRMEIRHPHSNLPLRAKDGTIAWIDVHSTDSEIGQRERRAITNARLAMRNRNALNARRLDDENTELLASLTTGWHLVDLAGDPIEVPFSRENAVELYGSRQMAWLREQVEAFAGDRANFSPASSMNSSPSPSTNSA